MSEKGNGNSGTGRRRFLNLFLFSALSSVSGCLGFFGEDKPEYANVTINVRSNSKYTGNATFYDGSQKYEVPISGGPDSEGVIEDAKYILPRHLENPGQIESISPPITVNLTPIEGSEELQLNLTLLVDDKEVGSDSVNDSGGVSVEYDP